MSGKTSEVWDSSGHLAMRRFFSRTGWEPVYSEMPFEDMMRGEEPISADHTEEDAFRERMNGVLIFYRFLLSRGAHPAMMLRQLAAVGRALMQPPFCDMTMEEVGQMFCETKAAHSYRCKVLSREVRLAGMKGDRFAGQQGGGVSKLYRVIRQENTNRKDGAERKKKAVETKNKAIKPNTNNEA